MNHPSFSLFVLGFLGFAGSSFSLAASNAAAPPAAELRNPSSAPERIAFSIRDGVPVQPGEVVIVLDPAHHTELLRTLRSELNHAWSTFKQAEATSVAWQEESDTKLKGLEAELSNAKRALDRYTQVDQPMESRALELAEAEADYALALQKERFEQRDKLLAEGIIRKLEWSGEEVALKRSTIAATNAKDRRKVFLETDSVAQIAKLEGEVKAKTAAIDAFRKAVPAEADRRNKEMESAKARFLDLEQKVVRAERAAQQLVITAPSAGIFRPQDGVAIGGTAAPFSLLGRVSTQ